VDPDLRPELAEAFGTFVILAAGGFAVLGGQSAPVVAGVFGVAVLAMVLAFGGTSGAHFNPAVTVAFAITRHFGWKRVAPYITAQLAGALAACLVLSPVGSLRPLVAHGTQTGFLAACVEAAATFVLAFVIVGVATDRRVPKVPVAFAIGGTVALGALLAGPLTGAALNPARALLPALFAGDTADLLPHLAGPLVGGALGMLAYEGLRRASRSPAPRAVPPREDA
jgi:glycerol uptake facilitator-like aquaporin